MSDDVVLAALVQQAIDATTAADLDLAESTAKPFLAPEELARFGRVIIERARALEERAKGELMALQTFRGPERGKPWQP